MISYDNITDKTPCEPQKCLNIIGIDDYETIAIDSNTIGIRPKWISVKERVPNDDQDVLVYHNEDDHITVGYFNSETVSFYIESDGSKFFTDDGWETEIPWAQKGRVTHWMPLPFPPKDI